MRNLLLMRHAKSSWSGDSLPDHQHPLNQRGKRDAVCMGRHLQEQGVTLDVILCSTAVRARATAKGLLREYMFEGKVSYFDNLYLADPGMIISVLNRLPDETATAMVIAHNPGLDDFLQITCDEHEHMATACVAYIKFPVERWIDLRMLTRGDLIHFWKPREL